MIRHPILSLTLAALFGLSLTVPCLAVAIQDAVPTKHTTGCASGEIPRGDLVCGSSFKPSPSHETDQSTSLAVVRIPSKPPVALSTGDGLDTPAPNPVAREHAPPAYLLHNAFLI